MWYIPLLMDPVSSTSSQTTPSIPRCTNVLTSSHRLLLSWSRLQLFNFAVGFHLRRRCGPNPRGYQRHHLPVRPRALMARRSRAQDHQMREVSWSATPETSDQRLGLHTSTCLATRRDSVCASSVPHRCLETRGVSLCYIQALCSLTDQVFELPLCQHRGAPMHQ